MDMHALLRRRQSEGGFGLPELMVVMLIIGLLLAIAVPNVRSSIRQARDREVTETVKFVANAFRDMTIHHPRTNRHKLRLEGDKTLVAYLDLNNNNTLDIASEPYKKITKPKKDIKVAVAAERGTYQVYGWDPKGLWYTSQNSAVVWDRSTGDFQDQGVVSPVPGL